MILSKFAITSEIVKKLKTWEAWHYVAITSAHVGRNIAVLEEITNRRPDVERGRNVGET
jgi:hypothetical protein